MLKTIRVLSTVVICLGIAASAAAQEPAEPQQAEPQIAPEQTEPQQTPKPAPAAEFPTDPVDRLDMARAAFRRAEYGILVPLLEPVEADPQLLRATEQRVEAREFLVVGYYFLAQQVKTHTDRDVLLTRARDAALELLREKPDHVLDSLVFPISIVDLVEDVRRENAEELNRLIAERQPNGSGEMQTIYLERQVEKHPKWVNLLPFAAGQFQNGDLVKGTIFAIIQGAGLTVNAVSYWMILRLRDPATGRYSSAGGQSSDLAAARRWRQALYGGLGTFAAAWIVSAVDGWLNHTPELVRIRTLDAPPPELNGPSADAGLADQLQLGLSLEFSW